VRFGRVLVSLARLFVALVVFALSMMFRRRAVRLRRVLMMFGCSCVGFLGHFYSIAD
jgi:hypothetical protein